MSNYDIKYTVRSIESYEQHSSEATDGTLRLACRDETGKKVWLELSDFGVGDLIAKLLSKDKI